MPPENPQGIIDEQRERYDAARAALEEVLRKCSQLSNSQVPPPSVCSHSDAAAVLSERA